MDVTAFRTAARAAIETLATHVERTAAGDGPAVAVRSRQEVSEQLDLTRLLRDGGLDPASFDSWLRRYLDAGVHLHHPGEMCHQVGPPGTGAALADLVHGLANQPMSIYEMGPAAASVEHAVVAWMASQVGWGAEAGGVLTHGGSLANLTALLAARARAVPDAWRDGVPSGLAILAAPSAHYSVGRAAGILGLGSSSIVPLDADHLGRIRPQGVPTALARLRARGQRPLAVVASACATATGLHDDLRGVGEVCRAAGVWLHVDGAHGASALLSPRLRGLLDGIELADSVVWDGHKMLGTSSLVAAVLVRRAGSLPAAFQQQASYLDVTNPDGLDVLDRQVECTKAELGLKLFLQLAFAGPAGVAAYVEGRYAAATDLWRMVGERPGFSAPYRPEANILCFRYGGPETDQDAIRRVLLADGRFHVGCADVAGQRHLRVVLMSPATDTSTLADLLDAVAAGAARVA